MAPKNETKLPGDVKIEGALTVGGAFAPSAGISALISTGTAILEVTNGIITNVISLLNNHLSAYLDTEAFTPINFFETVVDEIDGLTVKRISIYANIAGSGGSTGTVVRLSDGVTNCDVTLPPGSNFAEAVFSTSYTQESQLNISVFSDDNGSKPQLINVLVEYASVLPAGRLCGSNQFVNNSGIAIKIAEMTVDEPSGVYIKRFSADFVDSNHPGSGNHFKVTDGITDTLWDFFANTPGNNGFEYLVGQDILQNFINITPGVQTVIDQNSFAFTNGSRVRITDNADSTRFVEGVISNASGNQFDINVDLTGGAGSLSFQATIRDITYKGQFYAFGSVLTFSIQSDTSFGYTGMNAAAEYVPVNPGEGRDRFNGRIETLTGLPQVMSKATLDQGETIKRMSVVVADVGSGGSTGTVFRITDGITPLDLTLPPGSDNATAAFSQPYAAGAVVQLIAQSDDNGTPPTRATLVVEAALS